MNRFPIISAVVQNRLVSARVSGRLAALTIRRKKVVGGFEELFCIPKSPVYVVMVVIFKDQKYQKLRKHHQDLGVPWTDHTFPANDTSIGLQKVSFRLKDAQLRME